MRCAEIFPESICRSIGKSGRRFISEEKIFDWALKTGWETAELRRNEKSIPFGLKFRESIADMLVFSKIKTKMGEDFGFCLVEEPLYHLK